ncbi:acyl-CoA N-acyltransferase [Polyplosphaeria fusca]|uniref:Acyl-CoA N-acyltransferase n=1 Tax=Polyplosphaeria fusca TaxID=682080 RepID=A0A9P4R9W6_9PLEO|nr:acyl-CoA N-acyltransferase [Polyplosphaeria fusca]
MAPAVAPFANGASPSTPAPAAATSTPNATPKAATADPNVFEVVFGTLLIKPWYPSFYAESLVGRSVPRLYVCHVCFKYSKELLHFLAHLRACASRSAGPPGQVVYAKDGLELWEMDGEQERLYAQNLSLFAKLFLDTKSVFYDVGTFLYYLLVAERPNPEIRTAMGVHGMEAGAGGDGEGAGAGASASAREEKQVVGFFSKEKMSWDNNNLACILVFPPWQKQGLGQVLMGASYEISRREGRLGGPEKPLSDLGRRAYIHYWSTTLARAILGAPSKKTLTVLDLRNETYIVPEDIIATLQAMDVLEHRKRGGADAVINKAKVREWVERNRINLAPVVDPDAFVQEEADVEVEDDEDDE